jgi:hypothetical protein
MYIKKIHQKEAHGIGKARSQGHKTSRQTGHFHRNSKPKSQLKEDGKEKLQTILRLYK